MVGINDSNIEFFSSLFSFSKKEKLIKDKKGHSIWWKKLEPSNSINFAILGLSGIIIKEETKNVTDNIELEIYRKIKI